MLLGDVDSTNAEARRRIEAGLPLAGQALVAEMQTAGRGRRGHTWFSLPGRSLAFTAVVRTPAMQRPARVSLLAAVAAARACEALGSPALQLKWPNDLTRDEAKVGGLLIEAVLAPDGSELLLVGVGINLALAPGELDRRVDRTAGDVGLPGARDALAQRLLVELDRVLARPDDPAAGEEYRRRSWLSGREVLLGIGGRRLRGLLADVTPDGDLLLADGRLVRGEHAELLEVGPRSR